MGGVVQQAVAGAATPGRKEKLGQLIDFRRERRRAIRQGGRKTTSSVRAERGCHLPGVLDSISNGKNHDAL